MDKILDHVIRNVILKNVSIMMYIDTHRDRNNFWKIKQETVLKEFPQSSPAYLLPTII